MIARQQCRNRDKATVRDLSRIDEAMDPEAPNLELSRSRKKNKQKGEEKEKSFPRQ